MKEKKNFRDSQTKKSTSTIPELDIIDLEVTATPKTAESQPSEDSPERKRRFSHIYLHIAFLAVTFICVFFIIYRFINWGNYIDLNEIFKDSPNIDPSIETFDQILPLMDADGNFIYQDYNEDSVILAFGNSPFADDRDSKDNLVNIMQGMTDAKIYNCSISGSYLAADSQDLNVEEYPWDAFTFYGLCRLAVGYGEKTEDNYLNAVKSLGEDAPEEAMEIYNLLTTIDMNTVDVVVMMYDASDYFAGHKICDSSTPTDATYFTGNMEAAIECLQVFYPEIRIIILSPTYAYGVDENGNYVSSDIKEYGSGALSLYSSLQCVSCIDRNVTFVDNLYGTVHEDNAAKYLTDYLHLNLDGRQKVAQRFIDALYYYQESD